MKLEEDCQDQFETLLKPFQCSCALKCVGPKPTPISTCVFFNLPWKGKKIISIMFNFLSAWVSPLSHYLLHFEMMERRLHITQSFHWLSLLTSLLSLVPSACTAKQKEPLTRRNVSRGGAVNKCAGGFPSNAEQRINGKQFLWKLWDISLWWTWECTFLSQGTVSVQRSLTALHVASSHFTRRKPNSSKIFIFDV